MNKYISILCIVSLGLATSCKTASVGSNVSRQLDYRTQKSFEKIFFEASKQKALNNKEKALELYKTALGVYPKSHACLYQMAKISYQLKEYNSALSFAAQAVQNSPEYNHWYYGQLGQFYSKFGKYAESATVFSEMVDNEPDVRSNYVEAASQYYNAKQFDKSVTTLKKMQSSFGVEQESSTRLEFVYTALGKNDKAINEIEKLVAHYPNDLKYKGYLSDTYLSAGKVDLAVKTLEDILDEDSTVAKAYFGLYNIYNKEGKEDLAFEYLKKSFGFDDLSLQEKLQATSHYFLRLRSTPSIKNKLLDLSDILLYRHPKAIEPYLLRSDIHATLKEYKQARVNLKKGLVIDASEFGLWKKLIGLNARLQDIDQQLVDTEEAISLFPNIASLYSAKGYALIEKKRYADAITTANEGLDIALDKGDKSELFLCVATAYSKQNMFEKSDKTFDKILGINPYHSTVLNNYAYSLAERNTKLNKADSLINIALKIEPNNPFFMDTKAWVLHAKGKNKEAILLLNKCMKIDPENPEYYEHALKVYEALGNETLANDIRKKLNQLKNEGN